MELTIALAIVVIASVVIMFACESFDQASSYLGRNMAPGVKGATINAIGSSMPELMTALFLLFLYQDQDGFSAGIATTAGSAVFNSVVIPMLCIFAVRYRGILVEKESVAGGATQWVREKVMAIEIDKKGLIRDGLFLLMAEAALIWFLGGSILAWWMGGALMVIYLFYFVVLMRGFGVDEDEDKDEGDKGEEEEEGGSGSKLKALFTFDFNTLLYDGRTLTTGSAWVNLSLSVVVIGIACWQLADAVILSATALQVPTYFTAVIFAAAATSVPDTVLSVKDSMKGEYDDAIANALGSNTFDITVALGLPLLMYGLLYGDVAMSATESGQSQVQVLRLVLFGVTVAVLAMFLIPKRITVATAWLFMAFYAGWIGYLFYSAGWF